MNSLRNVLFYFDEKYLSNNTGMVTDCFEHSLFLIFCSFTLLKILFFIFIIEKILEML